jgi:secernin
MHGGRRRAHRVSLVDGGLFETRTASLPSFPSRSDACARRSARRGGLPALGCDTLVALPPATADGSTVFAKNSDRLAIECQPLVQVSPRRHPPGSRVRCQYVSISQVEETHGFIGSQPFWLWGLEHGVNDCRVAIGNEAVFSREPPGEEALLGMDLVRLGLERSETARQALDVVTGLLETHGQGGPAVMGTTAGYHNSFLIADATEAWILETSAKQWAARQVEGVGSISNHLTIEDDWSLASGDLEAYAAERGWWSAKADGGRIRFAGAYRDRELMPGRVSEGRFARGCALLGEGAGRLTPQDMMRFLRDHGESGSVLPEHRDPESADFFSLCLHADPVGTTTASMVARLRPQWDGLPDLWASLAAPCTGVFLPLYLEGDVPAAHALGGADPDRASPWWRFKALQDAVLARPRSAVVRLQSYWGGWEEELASRSDRLADEVRALQRVGDGEAIRRLISRFMEDNLRETLRRLDAWEAGEGATR